MKFNQPGILGNSLVRNHATDASVSPVDAPCNRELFSISLSHSKHRSVRFPSSAEMARDPPPRLYAYREKVYPRGFDPNPDVVVRISEDCSLVEDCSIWTTHLFKENANAKSQCTSRIIMVLVGRESFGEKVARDILH